MNILAHKCLFGTGETTFALQVEWGAYWRLPAVVTLDHFSMLDIGGRECRKPCPCYMQLYAASWLFEPPLMMLSVAVLH